MKPVNQTILAGDETGRPGNCVQAAVASLLELPLSRVPRFVRDNGPDDDLIWWWALLGFAYWCGFRIEDVKAEAAPPGEFVILIGPSPRGVRHACVGRDGKVVWDPHPSRAGLLEIERAWWFRPVTPKAQARWRAIHAA